MFSPNNFENQYQLFEQARPLFQQSDRPEPWAAVFFLHSKKLERTENNEPIFLQWCIEQFGEPNYGFQPTTDNRWAIVCGAGTTYMHFKFEEDANSFKMKWFQ